MRKRLQHAAQGGVRAAHPRVGVAVTGAGHRHVDGEHQRFHAGGLGALQRIAHKAAIFQHVELEPHRPIDRRRHLFDRADRHGGQRERNAFLAAARAACTSPRRAYMPVNPTGPSATGIASCSPNSVVCRLSSDILRSTRWRRAISARSAVLRFSVCSA